MLNKIKLLSHRTDLIMSGFEGSISDKGNYLVIKTPAQPDYFWGNFLLFPKEPQAGDYQKWLEIYKSEFSHKGFMTFSWDSSLEGNITEFTDNGFRLDKCEVLVTDKLIKPEKYNKQIIIREIYSDSDWQQYIDVHMNENWYLSQDSQKNFIESQIPAMKQLISAGLMKRFAAFINQTMVAELGIVFKDGIGRYNNISTHQKYRRQGICSTLVYETAINALNNIGLKQLVMVAAQDSHAAGIYKSVGFEIYERQVSLEWFNKNIYG